MLVVGLAVLFTVAVGLLYPIRYKSAVQSAAAEFGLPVELAFAVTAAESRFDPDALSPAGARGLMQLMPDTFAFAAQNVSGLTDIDDLQSNLRAGCWYLAYLLERFPLRHALAAYNAGEGRVREWIAAGLSDYPFPETAAYVKRVLAARRAYEYRL